MSTTTKTHEVWDHFDRGEYPDVLTVGQMIALDKLTESVWDKAFELGRDDGFGAGHEAGYDKGSDDGYDIGHGDSTRLYGSPDDHADLMMVVRRIADGQTWSEATFDLPASLVRGWVPA